MVQALRSTTEKRDLMKLTSFCNTEDTFNRTNQQCVDWERIFTKPTSDTVLISKIYQKLKKLDTNNPKNSTKTRGMQNKELFSAVLIKFQEELKEMCKFLSHSEKQKAKHTEDPFNTHQNA